MDLFFEWLGAAEKPGSRLAVMDMWKPFRNSTSRRTRSSRHPLRQVPRDAPPRGGLGPGEKDRVSAARLPPSANKVFPGFVEGLNNKIRVLQQRAYGLRDEQYLRLKILACILPEI